MEQAAPRSTRAASASRPMNNGNADAQRHSYELGRCLTTSIVESSTKVHVRCGYCHIDIQDLTILIDGAIDE